MTDFYPTPYSANPPVNFANLSFDNIKTQIIEYLRANSEFTDYDYNGSNLSVLINTLAYNTYISAYNSNMIANEVFLDTATLRENIVSLARNIGYVPRSTTAARANVSFTVTLQNTSLPAEVAPQSITLKKGIVCTGQTPNSSYTFSISEDITRPLLNNIATFEITVYEGQLVTSNFTVSTDNGSGDLPYVIPNSFVDTSTLRVSVSENKQSSVSVNYNLVNNIIGVTSTSTSYLIQEVPDEKYQLLFGDGVFGKKLQKGNYITANYIVTNGGLGNNASAFSFSGVLYDNNGSVITGASAAISAISTIDPSSGGSAIESASSIKYYAPRLYSSQYRAVTASDYEAIVPQLYANAQSVSVYGGEELNPPQYGKVFISIKPFNGQFLSEFTKNTISVDLKKFSPVTIQPSIVDLQYLYVELNSSIYYNQNFVGSPAELQSKVYNTLVAYSNSIELNKFGGRFKYSKTQSLIDGVDLSITSNITRVLMRRNLFPVTTAFSSYEICFGNSFHLENSEGFNIRSTGFSIQDLQGTYYFSDRPRIQSNGLVDQIEGDLIIFQLDSSGQPLVINAQAGKVRYDLGNIYVDTIFITATEQVNSIIEIEVIPESNDVIGYRELYVQLAMNRSVVTTKIDPISTGSNLSGYNYPVTPSYSFLTLSPYIRPIYYSS